MSQVSAWQRAIDRVTGRRPSAKGERPAASSHDALAPTLAALVRLRGDAKGLALAHRGRLTASAAGGFTSIHRGRGIDFEEVRVYQPGDDIRTMDWRVTARTGEPHTKVYRDERERPVLLYVAQNASMYFGTRVCFKSVVAARAAALLGWVTVDNGDRIGAFVHGRRQTVELPPMARSQGALKLCNALCAVHAEVETPVPATVMVRACDGLERLSRVIRSGNLLFVISDFYELDEALEQQLKRLSRHSDVVLIFVYDPLEASLPIAGSYPVTNGEQFLTLDLTTRKSRIEYTEVFERRSARLQDLSRAIAAPLIKISTTDDLVSTLRRGLPRSMW